MDSLWQDLVGGIYVMLTGLGAVGGVLLVWLVGAVNKMGTDEMRTRLGRIPAWLVAMAVRLAPPHQREFLQADWVDNLLVAFDEKHAGLDLTRLITTITFVFPLFGMSVRLRVQARGQRRRAELDEGNERLVEHVAIHAPVMRASGMILPPIVTWTAADGMVAVLDRKQGADGEPGILKMTEDQFEIYRRESLLADIERYRESQKDSD